MRLNPRPMGGGGEGPGAEPGAGGAGLGRGCGGAVSGRGPAPPVRPQPPPPPPGARLKWTVDLGRSVVPLPLREGASGQVSAGSGLSAHRARGADSRRRP